MIRDFALKLKFPAEAADFFQECYDKFTSNERWEKSLNDTVEAYFAGDPNLEGLHNVLVGEAGVRWESVDMTFLLVCALKLREVYQAKGLPEAIYWDSVQDLRYKVEECKMTFDCWGTFVTPWFHRWFLCSRFQFGRLQFETISFEYEDYKGLLKKGDVVYNCHIPSGGPLLYDEVLESLKQAREFFSAELKNGIFPVVCSSWLLYEPLGEVFPEGTNVAKFRECFDVIENVGNGENFDFCRVFGVMYSKEALANVVPRTGMQRRLKAYLEKGNVMGYGVGVLLFDGEKIVN